MTGKIFMCSLLLAMNIGKTVPEKSGIYVDGNISVELDKALVGGGIADPKKGSSFRLALQGNRDGGDMVAIRRGTVNSEVYITGFKYKDREYSSPGGFVNRIVIRCPEEIVIDLEQGKYSRSNPDVRAVTFAKFDIGKENAEILITITKKSGKTIVIAYRGAVRYDGLY